jgi:hypothetical protein
MLLLHQNILLKLKVAGLVKDYVFKFSPSNQAYLSNYSYTGAIPFRYAVILENFLVG